MWPIVIAMAAPRPERAEVVLELDSRRRTYEAVKRQPGVHLSDIARAAGLNTNHALYNLNALVRVGLLSSHEDRGFRRYYPRTRNRPFERDEQGPAEMRVLSALRRPMPLRIALLLLRDGPSTLRDLAHGVGRRPPSVSFHLDRLVERGVVVRLGATAAERRYAIHDPDATLATLVRFPPAGDVVATFIDLWDGLALPPSSVDPPSSGLGSPDPVPARTVSGNAAVARTPAERVGSWFAFEVVLRTLRLGVRAF